MHFDVTDALRTLGGQRVWSLLVTIFGDMAGDKGAVIKGPTLSAIMTAMQIRPEATRVALHRLRNDGWIASDKVGRTSHHHLTDLGRAQSEAARPRIYRPAGDAARGWTLVMTEDQTQANRMVELGFAMVIPRVFVGADTCVPPHGALVLGGSNVPLWLRREIAPVQLGQDYEALLAILQRADECLPPAGTIKPVDVAVLRCLIVHNWRRIVLKHVDLPEALLPPDWKADACRTRVHALLGRYPRPDLDDITP